MEQSQPNNRIANDLNDWKAREARFEKLFSPDISKDKGFLKEKLGFYDHLQSKYGKSASEEEKMVLRVVSRMSNQLRKEIYPGFWQRMLQKVLLPFKQKQQEKQSTLKLKDNLKDLEKTLSKAGFDGAMNQVRHQISLGNKQFSIPISQYVNENQKMDFNLSFSKDASGVHKLEKYDAALISENKQQETRKQTFLLSEAVSASQAQNLLSGRAIFKDSPAHLQDTQTAWMKLDFNDKDQSGNHRHKIFNENYGYDLLKALAPLNLKEVVSESNKQQLLDSLKNGNREMVTMQLNGKETKLFIEASPQYKTVNLYNENAKAVSLAELLNGSRKQVSARLNQDVSEKQAHSKRNGSRQKVM